MKLPDSRESQVCARDSAVSSHSPLMSYGFLGIAFLIFFLATVALHHAGFSSPMIYDSKAWINDKIHIFASHDLIKIVQIVPMRPLYMLSLYANYLATGMDPYFFRLTNVVLLAATGVMLMLFIRNVLEISGIMPDVAADDKRWIAFFLGLVFVLHPLQTLAVLYVWQREAILACLFYFSCLASYLAVRGRAFSGNPRGYALPATLFFLGLLCKENIVTLPAMLVLVEVILFRQSVRQVVRSALIIAAVAASLMLVYFVFTGHLHGTESVAKTGILSRLAQYYDESGLTPVTVILTECRVFFSYILSIILPLRDNVQLVRAETVSSSFMNPPVTLLAFGGVIGSIAIGMLWCRKKPLVAFGIFFCMLAASPESLLIPQFLFFGYRAILPMAGVLLIAAQIIGDLLPFARRVIPERWLGIVLNGACGIVVVALAAATHIQARAWNPSQFWEHAYAGLPAFSSKVEITPYVTVLMSYGGVLVGSGQYDKGIDMLARAIRIGCGVEEQRGMSRSAPSPHSSDGMNLTELAKGPCPNMREEYHSAYNDLGMALSALGRPLEAIPFYQAALKLKPGSADAYNNWGETTLKLGHVAEAVKLFRAALHAQPHHAVATNNLGEALLRSGQREEAIRMFHKAIELRPDYGGAFNNLGNVVLAEGRVPEAIELYRKGIAVTPNSPELRNNLGAALFSQGRVVQAQEEFRAAVRLRPQFAKARVNVGMVALKSGEIPEALNNLTEALRIDPKLSLAYVYLGQARELSGHMDEAIQDYARAVELTPHLVPALYCLARAKAKVNDTRSAKRGYKEVLQLDSHHYGAHFGLGCLYLASSELDEAIRHLRKAVAIRPDSLEARRSLNMAEQRASSRPPH